MCWQAGDLSYAMTRVQLRGRALVADCYSRNVRRIVWNWGRRLGKSHAAVALALEVAIRVPGARIPYAASTRDSVEEFIDPIFAWYADHAPPTHRPEQFKGAWVLPNESRIVPVGCEDRKKANRLRGPRAHACVVDEAAFIPCLDYVVRDVLVPQLVTTRGWILLCSTPPETPAHAFVGYIAEAEGRDAYMHASTRESELLTAEDIDLFCQELGGPESTQWLREGEAMIVVDESRAVLPEWRTAHALGRVVGEQERPEHFDAYTSADLGYLDLTFALFGYWDFKGNRLVIEDEAVMERPNSARVQRTTSEKEATLWHGQEPYRRVCDASAITVADMRALEVQKRQGVAADDGEDNLWTLPQKDDKQAAINALRVAIVRGEILVHPRCRQLIAHCSHAIWNEARTEFARSGGLGHFDGVDALLYMHRSVVRTRNPFPSPLDGLDVATQHVFGGVPKRGGGWFGTRRERR